MREQRLLQSCEDGKRFSEIDLGHVLELGNARRCQETLEAKHAARRQRPERGGIAGDDTAPESHVDVAAPIRGTQLRFQAIDVVVAGMLLSGMSTSDVTPPAAAARVACSNPSQSARPGSLMCTCVSTSPGNTTSSPASKAGMPGGRSRMADDIDDPSIADSNRRGAHAVG